MSMRSRQFNASRGLTALESIVILASIVVIVAIMVPKVANSRDKQARDNIHQAIRDGDMKSIRRALKPTAIGETPIVPDAPVSEKWTAPDGSASTMNYCLLSYAVKWGHAGVVQALIDYGSNTDGEVWGNDRQPIFWAAYNGNQEIFDLLIRAGADPNAVVKEKTALGHAEGVYDEAAAFLRANGAEQASVAP